MPLPSLKDQFGALIAASSVSCTQPELDQTNRPVVDLLASWLGDLGFRCEIREVSPGKFNLLAQRRRTARVAHRAPARPRRRRLGAGVRLISR